MTATTATESATDDMPPAERCALALTIAYDGAGFAGFARQPGQKTVQGELERALATVLRCPIDVAVAGRTDAGVHARGQVVSFPWNGSDVDSVAFVRSLNALVGVGIAVRDVRVAAAGFSARFDAVRREYRYRIASGPVPPVFLRHVGWWYPKPLDADAMRAAAQHFVGERDFRSFCVSGSAAGKRTFRRVEAVEISSDELLGEPCLVVRVVGNAFLHSMVRVMVGTLTEVGRGARDPAWVADAIAACQRSAAGPTAPANGLTLWSVDYRDGVWL